jgi:hypothetical protein
MMPCRFTAMKQKRLDGKGRNRDAWAAMTETMLRTGTPTASPAVAAIAWRWWAHSPAEARLHRW